MFMKTQRLLWMAVCFSLLPLEPVHASMLYWTNRFDGEINVSDLTSLTTTTLIHDSSLTPWGIAVTGSMSDVYFLTGANANSTNAGLKLFSGGVTSTLLSSTQAVRQLEVDQAHNRIFWAAEGDVSGGADSIYSANLDGSGAHPIQSGLWNPRAMAYDPIDEKIYWDSFILSTFTRTIYRSNADGSAIETVVAGESSSIWGMDLDPVNRRLYWGDAAGRLVRSSNLDGSGVGTIVSGVGFDVLDIQVDPVAGKFYFSGDNSGGVPGGKIMRANLDGSGAEVLFSNVEATNIFLVDSPAVAPEPTSIALLTIGAAGGVFGVRRRRKPTNHLT